MADLARLEGARKCFIDQRIAKSLMLHTVNKSPTKPAQKEAFDESHNTPQTAIQSSASSVLRKQCWSTLERELAARLELHLDGYLTKQKMVKHFIDNRDFQIMRLKSKEIFFQGPGPRLESKYSKC
jgi:hypothetical protein